MRPPTWGSIVENCRVFHATSSTRYGQESGRWAPSFRTGFVSIDPGYRDENAALAPQAWLLGIKWDLSPQDPVAAAHRVACDNPEADPLRREQCYRASAGHPNALGAQAYAAAIVNALAGVV